MWPSGMLVHRGGPRCNRRWPRVGRAQGGITVSRTSSPSDSLAMFAGSSMRIWSKVLLILETGGGACGKSAVMTSKAESTISVSTAPRRRLAFSMSMAAVNRVAMTRASASGKVAISSTITSPGCRDSSSQGESSSSTRALACAVASAVAIAVRFDSIARAARLHAWGEGEAVSCDRRQVPCVV